MRGGGRGGGGWGGGAFHTDGFTVLSRAHAGQKCCDALTALEPGPRSSLGSCQILRSQ